MLSVIIVSYKEPLSIAKAINAIADKEYSGIDDNYEIIQVSPDKDTLTNGYLAAEKLNILNNFIQIKDPQKGKPYALNLAFKKAKGDIFVLTDGDVYFERNAIKNLISPFVDPEIGGVTGRPISIDSKTTMMNYYGNLLTDAAHDKRLHIMNRKTDEGYFIADSGFFPLSGYICAVRNLKIKLPSDTLVDDAYISYAVFNKDYKLAYEPRAKVFVKFPKTLNDYFKQKVRSLGGYTQLRKYDIVKKNKNSRTFFDELAYFWFPITYAETPKESIWSLLLYPIRFWTWILIAKDRVLGNKSFSKSWTRIESTK